MEKKLLPEEIVQIRMDLTNKASAVTVICLCPAVWNCYSPSVTWR